MPVLAAILVLNAKIIENLPLAEQGEPMIYVLSFGYCQRIVQQIFFGGDVRSENELKKLKTLEANRRN